QAEGDALLGFERAALVEGSNIPADRIAAFALIEQTEGRLDRLVEKPDAETLAAAGEDALGSMNCFAFTLRIFAACARIEPSRRDDIDEVQRRLAGVEVSL